MLLVFFVAKNTSNDIFIDMKLEIADADSILQES